MKYLALFVAAIVFAAVIVPLTRAASEKAAQQAEISLSSFGGSGSSFSLKLDSDIVSYERMKKYDQPGGEKLKGGGYDIVYSFKGLKPGETTFIVEERSVLLGNTDYVYSLKVDESLNVSVKQISSYDADKKALETSKLVLSYNGSVMKAAFEDNRATRELLAKMSTGPVKVEFERNGDSLMAGELPWKLAVEDRNITVQPGDILVQKGRAVSINYGTGEGRFTRLGTIADLKGEQISEFPENEKSTVILSIESRE